jgi:hypothetical protein
MRTSPSAEAKPVDAAGVEPSCPFHVDPGVEVAPAVSGCPVQHGGAAPRRTRADMIVRRMLRIPEQPVGATDQAAYRAFQRSMFISAVRCLLTYVVFPFVLPALSFANGFGPAIGIVIGAVAMVCDVFAVRRFFAVDHRWRWRFAAVASGVVGLLFVLLVQDIVHLVT